MIRSRVDIELHGLSVQLLSTGYADAVHSKITENPHILELEDWNGDFYSFSWGNIMSCKVSDLGETWMAEDLTPDLLLAFPSIFPQEPSFPVRVKPLVIAYKPDGVKYNVWYFYPGNKRSRGTIDGGMWSNAVDFLREQGYLHREKDDLYVMATTTERLDSFHL